jgi:hypothetical protein
MGSPHAYFARCLPLRFITLRPSTKAKSSQAGSQEEQRAWLRNWLDTGLNLGIENPVTVGGLGHLFFAVLEVGGARRTCKTLREAKNLYAHPTLRGMPRSSSGTRSHVSFSKKGPGSDATFSIYLQNSAERFVSTVWRGPLRRVRVLNRTWEVDLSKYGQAVLWNPR